ncbi:protein KRTCAP2 homolog [Euwallacea similis]|uniref:protein KRTCAP2 homolog n=1 Tax=Euwallacea similis TaxID=1736056 RepID=UPI00344F60FF
MVATTKTSLTVSIISCFILVSAMQMWKTWLASSSQQTLLGGLLGSFLFTFILTAIGNCESIFFGKSYTVGVFPEVAFSLLLAVSAAASVHRVAGTSSLLLSLLALFYINRYSQKVHVQVTVQPLPGSKKKKNN